MYFDAPAYASRNWAYIYQYIYNRRLLPYGISQQVTANLLFYTFSALY